MKPFRTDLALAPDPFLERGRSILTLGSCFAESIGQKLLDFKWPGLSAPFGTLFHPLALQKLLGMALDESALDESLFVEHDGAIFHHDLHSRFFAPTAAALQEKWREIAAAVRNILKLSPCVLLTLGTAWVYERKEGSAIVANCHKQAGDRFSKRLLQPAEIRAALEAIRSLLPESSSLIISLSPVRHTRDTMIGNALSKSLLLVVIHDFIARHGDRYFPAYEIMLDDLRDYRFYEADMIHPSSEAIDYIWEKFIETYADPGSKEFLKVWSPIQGTLRHHPVRVDAPSYQKHLRSVLERLDAFPELDCSQERFEIERRLIS